MRGEVLAAAQASKQVAEYAEAARVRVVDGWGDGLPAAMAAAVQARGGGLVRLRVRQDHEVGGVDCMRGLRAGESTSESCRWGAGGLAGGGRAQLIEVEWEWGYDVRVGL